MGFSDTPMVNFDSPLPYYIQIRDRIKEQIAAGTLKHGDQLPGEPALCQLCSVSRTVIRQALAELENEGLVTRKKGIGTFIAEPETFERLSAKLTGFYQDMRLRGHTPFTRMLNQEVIPADEIVSRYLQIEPGTPVVRLNRLRFIDMEPIVLTDTYLPAHLVPGLETLDLTRSSLYEVLEHHFHLNLSRGHRVIGAAAASDDQAALFQVHPRDPMIVITNVTFAVDGTPVEYYHGLYRGDRNIFEVEMIRQNKLVF